MIKNMNATNCMDDYIARLKSRYPRDNAVLDLLYLIEHLREENRALLNAIVSSEIGVISPKQRNPAGLTPRGS